MANRINRFNFDTTLHYVNDKDDVENDDPSSPSFQSSSSGNSRDGSEIENGSYSINASIDEREERLRKQQQQHKRGVPKRSKLNDFKVNSNPFEQRSRKNKRTLDKSHRHRKRKENKNNPSSTATSVTVVVPPTTTTSNVPVPGASDWNPCSISEDVDVFKRYGIDPKHANHHHNHDGTGCYGCNVQCDIIPVKQSNMKVLLEKIAQSGVNSGSVLSRAETIRSNYLDLIVKPKQKLSKLLKKRSHDDMMDDVNPNEDINMIQGDENSNDSCFRRPNKSRRLNDNKNQLSKEIVGGDDDEWSTLGIYNHLMNHQMNVIEQVQYRRNQIWKMMNEMDRNSVFVEHSTKKNVFGESLKRADADQVKTYINLNREWLALSKSRPDLMRPFYDADRVNSQGTTNTREGEGNIINVSGQLLFGKKKR